jgi:hypothetical protein
MMFVASTVVWLNTLPIWHYEGEANGEELFEIVGYGWPFRVCTIGLSWGASWLPPLNWVSVGLNLLFMILVTAYVATLLEWRWISPAARGGLVLGSIVGVLVSATWFVGAYIVSSLPAVTEVSLSIGFKPGWQNWRSASAVFIIVGLVGLVVGWARWFVPRGRPSRPPDQSPPAPKD